MPERKSPERFQLPSIPETIRGARRLWNWTEKYVSEHPVAQVASISGGYLAVDRLTKFLPTVLTLEDVVLPVLVLAALSAGVRVGIKVGEDLGL